ncbi:hypothetical protein BU17DRAFT_62110 [Hysterangium stoloniferum]|nr:hypothetical protein BU17DRAFT_62110 [Hysterangium stoloniferum]
MTDDGPSPSYPGISTPAAIAKGKSGRDLIVCIDGTSNCSGVMLDETTRPLQSLTPQVKALACRKRDSHHRKIPRIKEVWFPGTHSDIAGGSVVNGNLDRRLPSFLWISFEAVWAGLKLDRSNVAWRWDESANGVTWW